MNKLLLLLLSCGLISYSLAIKVTNLQPAGGHRAKMRENKKKFQNFVASNGKNYKTNSEYREALKNFQRNSARVEACNEANKDDPGKLKMGINKYSDLTDEEFHDLMQLDR